MTKEKGLQRTFIFYVIILAVFKLLEQVCMNFVIRKKSHFQNNEKKIDKDFKALYK